MLQKQKELRHENLCLRAMVDLKMEPEDFGAFLYTATVRRQVGLDPEELREESATARKLLMTLPYGWELFCLERELLQ